MRPLLLALLLLPNLAAAFSPKALEGRAVMEKAQCTRCHPMSGGIAPAERDMHCVDCHVWILDTRGKPSKIAEMRKDFPDWDRYLETIVHFTRLPDLGTLTRHVRPAFVRKYLDAPFDLRPHLDESMIPLRLSAAQKDAVVAYLTEINAGAVAKDSTVMGLFNVKAGQKLFAQRGCPTCHVVGNLRFGPTDYSGLKTPLHLAPDLRFTRDRMPYDTLVRFIQNPQAVDPQSAMPSMGVTDHDARLIAGFLVQTPLELAGTAVTLKPIVNQTRTVTYDEVFDEVLGKICVHCHMNPESNNGDGGAGNTGGLGYAGLKLDLETYAGVKKGMLRAGKRVDILKPEKSGEPPLLVKVLLQRRLEARRDRRRPFEDLSTPGPATSAQHPGMPLGLPPLSDHQISLIQTWIAQGAQEN